VVRADLDARRVEIASVERGENAGAQGIAIVSRDVEGRSVRRSHAHGDRLGLGSRAAAREEHREDEGKRTSRSRHATKVPQATRRNATL
jgi:hypothetical protein